MKNKNILPGELVPDEIRLEVYKEALSIIEAGEFHKSLVGYKLCLLLPCILWDLDSYLHIAPSGIAWCYKVTPNMFPEVTREFFMLMESGNYRGAERNILRAGLLRDAIELLTPKL